MANLKKNGLRWLFGIYPFIQPLNVFQTLHILGNKKAIFYLHVLLKIKSIIQHVVDEKLNEM